MGEWTVTEESVEAIKNLRAELNTKVGEIAQEVLVLIESYEDNKDGLGYHSGEILNLLKDLRSTTDEANGLVKRLVKKLKIVAAIRKNHIDTPTQQAGKGRSR